MSENVVPAADDVRALCAPFLDALPVTGALVSVIDIAGIRTGVAVSDPVAARWDELELELGSGPLTTAASGSMPERIDDVRTADVNPVLSEGLVNLGVRALLALPLLVGRATVGVAGLYSARGPLSARELGIASDIARHITLPTIRAATRLAQTADAGDQDDRGGLRREVHQATGMVSAVLDISLTDAFARLRAAATASGRSINAIAVDIVDRRLDARTLDSE